MKGKKGKKKKRREGEEVIKSILSYFSDEKTYRGKIRKGEEREKGKERKRKESRLPCSLLSLSPKSVGKKGGELGGEGGERGKKG